jgi:Flp pilus assembly protein TadG
MTYSWDMEKLLTFLRGHDAGNIAITTALVMPLVIAGAGFGFETTYWYYKDMQLQQAADKAAYAGALELRSGASYSVIKSSATATATENGYSPGTIAVLNAPTSGTYSGNAKAIEVKLTNSVPRFFTRLWSTANIVETARAVALTVDYSKACVLALDKTAAIGVKVGGSTTVSLTGCSVMANSTSATSVDAFGAAVLTTECVIAAGKVYEQHAYNIEMGCANAIENAPFAPDPYAALVEPATPANAPNPTGPAANRVYSPGYYPSGLSFSGNGTVTLSPGVYVVNTEFKTNGNVTINGTGVTIILKPSATVSMNGTARITLQAPTSGTYKGMLFFGSRTGTGTNTFNGTANSRMTGAIYTPNQAVQYNGNFSGLGGCTQVVGKTVDWNGNASISQDCTAYGMSSIPATQLIKLVE